MSKHTGDDYTTAAITVGHKHRGAVQLSDRESARRDLNREAHNYRMQGNRWGQVLKLLIESRDNLRYAAKEDSLFPARNDRACCEVVTQAASALGPAIADAMQKQKQADQEAERVERQLVALEKRGNE